MVTDPSAGIKHAFVTGATGIVGKPLCRVLVDGGVRVTAYSRSATENRIDGVEYVRGDILAQSALAIAADGADVIFHVAAAVHGSAETHAEFERMNVQGTENVVQAARKTGAKLVHVSSVNVEGYRSGKLLDSYAVTKSQGEQLVSEAAKDGVDAVIVRPASVFGNVGGQAGLIVDRLLSGRLKVLPAPARKISPVWADDLGRALVGAAMHGESGQTYTVAGPTISTADFVNSICVAVGVRKPLISVPGGLIAIPLRLAEWISRITRWKPPFSVESLLAGSVHDGSEAASKLEFEYTPIKEIFGRRSV